MRRSRVRLETIEPERVCIIKPSSMGDILHAMPILSALRARWPSAHLAWVVNRSFAELLEGHRDLDELIVYNRGRRGLDRDKFLGMAALLARLRRSRFDLTIDLQGLLRSAMMVAAAGAQYPRRDGRCPRGRPLVLHPSCRRAPAGRTRGRSGPARRPLVRRRRLRGGIPPPHPRRRPPMGRRDGRRAPEAPRHPQCRGAMGDQALAARALRGHRPACGRTVRSEPDRRRLGRRSAVGRTPCSAISPRSRPWTSAAGRACRSSRPSASNPTWWSPTTPAPSTWPPPPGRGSSASIPAPVRSSRARMDPGAPRSSLASGAPPASASPAAASTA